MMNPKTMLQMKGILDRFQRNHPKIPQFLNAAAGSIDEGSIIEVTLTTSGGRTLCTNMRVTQDNLDLVQSLKSQTAKK